MSIASNFSLLNAGQIEALDEFMKVVDSVEAKTNYSMILELRDQNPHILSLIEALESLRSNPGSRKALNTIQRAPAMFSQIIGTGKEEGWLEEQAQSDLETVIKNLAPLLEKLPRDKKMMPVLNLA